MLGGRHRQRLKDAWLLMGANDTQRIIGSFLLVRGSFTLLRHA